MPSLWISGACVRVALIGFGLASGQAVSADWPGQALVAVYGAAQTGKDGMTWTAVQDRDGTMHFGSDGMASFDGAQWRSDLAGSGYAIRGLDNAGDGRLWAAATGDLGWFAPDQAGGWAFHSLRDRLPPDEREFGELWAAHADGDGALFVGRQTLYWWDGAAFRVERFFDGSRISAVRVGRRFFIHELSSGLWEDDGHRRRLLVPASGLPGAVVWMEPGAGGWLLGTTHGFLRLTQGHPEPVMREGSAFARRFGLTAVRRLGSDRIAVATLRGGIAVVADDGRVLRVFDRATGLPTDEVFSLAVDREGGLWGTAGAAIFRISVAADPWWYHSRDPAERSTCVGIADDGGALGIAADSEVLTPAQGGSRLATVGGELRHCWGIAATPVGLLVACNREIARLGPGGLTTFRRFASDAFAICPAGAGLVAASAGRDLYLLDSATGETRGGAHGLPDAASTLAQGCDGMLYLGTPRSGVLRAGPAAPGGPWKIDRVPGLPTEGQASVAGGSDGTVWAFGDRGGWILASGHERFAPIADYPARRVCASEGGADGRAWVVHPTEGPLGACVAQIVAGRWIPRLIEGLQRIGIPEAIHAQGTGAGVRLWVGGTEGVVALNIDRSATDAPPTAPRLQVFREGRLVAGGAITVPYAMSDLTIVASLPAFGLRPALISQWRLDGIDSAWEPVGPEESRRVSSLREGAYRIRARTLAASGAASPEVAVVLTVLPPWWRTRPVAMAGVIAAIGAALLLHRWRSAALRRRNARLETAVAQRTAEAAQAQAEKTRLIAGISHDIRNPLSAIVGMSLGLEEGGLEEPQRRLVESMRSCARYLDRLVADVIDFARVESGPVELRPERCSPKALLREAAAIVQAEADAAGAEVRVRVEEGTVEAFWADAGRIRQILVNLAANAIKHAGGEIELVAAPSVAPRGAIEFAVIDHGPGIATEEQSGLFRPFARGAERTPRPPGSGLGLATSKRWAELMGGTIALKSGIGQGTRFSLRLPAPLPPELVPAQENVPAFRRVLIVEDDDYNHWAISAVLGRFGATVAARARNGREALALAAEAEFDLLTLDRRLPDLDGVEVCRELRSRGAKVGPIIALSACASEADQAAWREAGADAFVAKPLTPDKLRAALAGNWLSPAPGRLNLRLLRSLADDEEPALERYLAELANAGQALDDALSTATRREIATAAHRLASHLRMVDATEEATLALSLESAARSQHENLAIPGSRLRAACDSLPQRLRDVAKSAAGSSG